MLNQLLISVILEINLQLSPMNLFFTEAVCCEEINIDKAVLICLK